MVYKTCAHYTRATCHWIIDHAIPVNSQIATASGAVSWYVWNYGLSHFPRETNEWIQGWTCNRAVYFVIGDYCKTFSHYGPETLLTPWIVPRLSHTWSVGAGMATSFFLNIIATKIFGVKINPEKKPEQITDRPSPAHPVQLIEDKRGKDKLPPPMIELAVGKYLKDLRDSKDPKEKKELKEEAVTKNPAVAITREKTTPVAIEPPKPRKPRVAVRRNPKIKIKSEQLPICDCIWKFCRLPLKA